MIDKIAPPQTEEFLQYPLRAFIFSIAVTFTVHFGFYWIYQAGIFRFLGEPASLLSSMISWGLIIAPFFQVTQAIALASPFSCPQIFLVVIGGAALIVKMIIYFHNRKIKSAQKKSILYRDVLLNICSIFLIPSIFAPLPQYYNISNWYLVSLLMTIGLCYYVRASPVSEIFAICSFILFIHTTVIAFEEGRKWPITCSENVRIILKDNKDAKQGCWLISTEKALMWVEKTKDTPPSAMIFAAPHETIDFYYFLGKSK